MADIIPYPARAQSDAILRLLKIKFETERGAAANDLAVVLKQLQDISTLDRRAQIQDLISELHDCRRVLEAYDPAMPLTTEENPMVILRRRLAAAATLLQMRANRDPHLDILYP